MHLPHVGALETTVVAEDWSGTIEFRSTVDGNVTNSLVERYRDLASEHLGSAVTRELSNNSVLLTVRDQPIAAFPSPWPRETPCGATVNPSPPTYQLFDHDAEIGHDIAVLLSAGESVTIEKIVTVYTGRDVATSEPGVDAQRWVARPRPVRRAARRTSDRLDASVGAVVHRIRRLHRRSADPATASATPAADGVAEHRRPRRRGAGPRAARRGVSRPHLLGRAVHLPGAQPAAPDGDPVAARLPLPAAAGGQASRPRGRPRRRDVPLAVRQRRSRGKPTAAPESAQRPLEPGRQRPRAPHRYRRRLQRVEVLSGHRRPRLPDRLRRRAAGRDRAVLRQPGHLRRRARTLRHPRRHRPRRVPLRLSRRPVRRHRQQRVHQRHGGLGHHARHRRTEPAAAAEPPGSDGDAGTAQCRARRTGTTSADGCSSRSTTA